MSYKCLININNKKTERFLNKKEILNYFEIGAKIKVFHDNKIYKLNKKKQFVAMMNLNLINEEEEKKEKEEKMIIKTIAEDFYFFSSDFGSSDIIRAIEICRESNIFNCYDFQLGKELNSFLIEKSKDFDCNINDLDICSLLYEEILNSVISEINQYFPNNPFKNIIIYSNYMCTSFDCSEEEKIEINEFIQENRETINFDDNLLFILDELEISY